MSIRTACPTCHTTLTVQPSAVHIAASLDSYRTFCARCVDSPAQSTTAADIAVLLEHGVRVDPAPLPLYPPLGPAELAAETQAFDPDLLLVTCQALNTVDLRDRAPRPVSPIEADIAHAAAQFDTAVDSMRDKILDEVDALHFSCPGWRDAQRLDPWALAETLVRATTGHPGDYIAYGHMLAAQRENDRTGIYDPADTWIVHLADAAVAAVRTLVTHAPEPLVTTLTVAFTHASPEDNR